ncbi:helix-turn-helix domain-containing protein [Facklamia hominis]|uniref:helix-turn-helix domain-containing protein n=1 Tax=Facklamia hominis TaxID=178214 RepID=UPI0038FD3085
MNIGERINYLRTREKISADDLGKMVGVSRATIYRYENGDIEKFPIELLDPIARALRTTPEYLMGWDDNTKILDVYSKLESQRQKKVYQFAEHQLHEQNNNVDEQSTVYLVGQTAAGEPLEYGQLQPEQISVDVPKGADRALNVKGDSMEPLIKDGSIVFYKDQPTVENGEIAIVEIDGSEVTCKKFYFDGEKVTLKSINEKYEDMVFNNGVRIIGKVILN